MLGMTTRGRGEVLTARRRRVATLAALSMYTVFSIVGAGSDARAQDLSEVVASRLADTTGAVSPARRMASKQALANDPSPPSLLSLLASKQGICVGSDLHHVEDAPALEKHLPRAIQRLEKATVRLRVTHASFADKAFLEMKPGLPAGATAFSLNSFAALAGMDEGICSGTYIGNRLVVTAAHCLSEQWWLSRSFDLPTYEVGGQRRSLTPGQFARLLVVDFNYQANLQLMAAADDLKPAPVREPLPFRVSGLVAPSPPAKLDHVDLDYAVIGIIGTDAQLEGRQLGLAKVSLNAPRRDTGVVVFQHPNGHLKKVAHGRIDAVTDRILHTASTERGSSGAGVLDRSGNLIGVHIEGGCDEEGSANRALPFARIKPQLRRILGR